MALCITSLINECRYAECRIFIVVPCDIMLSVVMLSVVAPLNCLEKKLRMKKVYRMDFTCQTENKETEKAVLPVKMW